ncbi:hypothetical protein ACGFI9_23055 [Micromonospora sp. NPDC048930]|uniref:hypothetical protein n=1 Tax=Micromonospora sp. NPDC048930 TaxID=3364261 RepID=UPI0037154021
MQDALDLARRHGWWYRKAEDHTGAAQLYCRRDSEEHCFFPIFGTGKSPGGPARSLKRKVRTCTHRIEEEEPKIEQAERLLSGADRLIAAAESLLHRARLHERVDEALAEAEELETIARATELLEVAEANVVRIDELIERADEWDMEATAAGRDARETLAAEGVETEDPNVPVDAAEEVIREAEAVLDEVPRRLERVADLRNTANLLRGRISVVRTEIASTTRS